MDTPHSVTIVIFGATGNLARAKLLPALYQLEQAGQLADGTRIIGFGRREWNDEEWREDVRRMCLAGSEDDSPGNEAIDRLLPRLHFHGGDHNDPNCFSRLAERLERPEYPDCVMFYFAVSPQAFGAICHNLAGAGLTDESTGCRRVVIEKPFGHDIDSAHALDSLLHQHFEERQIFRIDHYLGK
ncbi:MAG: glucose-6-phosphate dehydrogenase, partial [Guyparkeria sp.]